ncbi:helix-turn-helix transcriptional regulator [Tenacibaculum sp. SSH1-16]|uniref:helix-turn-helix domain-containing protein n=1 Tax=Tenacibaculum sp. SSH1-16 TaxID=3136667 RepID=UPI0032C4410B|nr:hypothetical protein BACY1_20800 [Tenacibaculum mesophilum]
MTTDFISHNIKYLVEREKETKDAFGRMFDLNRGSVSSYIEGKSKPKIETLQKIAVKFNVTIDDLVNRDLSKIDKLDEVLLPNDIIKKFDEISDDELTLYITKNKKRILENEIISLYIDKLATEKALKILANEIKNKI